MGVLFGGFGCRPAAHLSNYLAKNIKTGAKAVNTGRALSWMPLLAAFFPASPALAEVQKERL
jgi:hypothetical protein